MADASGNVSATPPAPTQSIPGLYQDLKRGKSTSHGIVIATRELFINDTNPKNADAMASMLFDQIGAEELASVATQNNINPNFVNSEKPSYSPVKDLYSIASKYNSQNIVALQGKDVEYFKQFPISIWDHIPAFGGGPNGSVVYMDLDNSLTIEAVNILDGIYYIEAEIFSIGEVIDDTIYMED